MISPKAVSPASFTVGGLPPANTEFSCASTMLSTCLLIRSPKSELDPSVRSIGKYVGEPSNSSW